MNAVYTIGRIDERTMVRGRNRHSPFSLDRAHGRRPELADAGPAEDGQVSLDMDMGAMAMKSTTTTTMELLPDP